VLFKFMEKHMKKVNIALIVVALLGASSVVNAAAVAAPANMSMLDRAKLAAKNAKDAAGRKADAIKNSSFGKGAANLANKASTAAGNAAGRVRSSSADAYKAVHDKVAVKK
jgi:hypothetical protein